MAFKVTHVEAPSPERSVKLVEIPTEVRDAMEAEWEFAQKNPAYQTVIGGETAAEALQNLVYAKAWGAQRARNEDGTFDDAKRVIITRFPSKPGKDSPLDIRVSLTKFDPNATKRGRPVASNGNGATEPTHGGNGVTPPAETPPAETPTGSGAKAPGKVAK